MQKYNPENTYILVLSDKHLGSIKDFNSRQKELNEFLSNDAYEYQKLGLGITYLLVLKENDAVISYLTLSTGTLKLPENKEEFIFKGKKLHEYPKDFPNQFPAILIGKLATDERKEGNGAASLLLDFATSIAIKIREDVGCAFIVAHAKTSNSVVDWYLKKGFKTYLKDTSKRETVPVYLEL